MPTTHRIRTPEEVEKSRLLRYEWIDSYDLDDPPQRKRALMIEKAVMQDGQSFKVYKSRRPRSQFAIDQGDHRQGRPLGAGASRSATTSEPQLPSVHLARPGRA